MVAERWARVKSLLGQALSLRGSERVRYFAALQNVSSETRAEALRLIGASDSDSAQHPEDADSPAPTFERQLQSGQIINDRYAIRDLLGMGGMGEVYEAFDLLTEESLAIKTVPAHLSLQPDYVTRLKREVQLAHRVSHPNVCRVYQLNRGLTYKGQDMTFLTMELVRGEPLSQIIRQGPLPLLTALEIATQIASGLDAAHKAGVLHRDLKSNNIMLVRSPVTRTVILDFGLAREQDVSPGSFLTGSAIVGTPEYMSPEQLQGLELTVAADIYAFGVVIFEMVTGKKPFEGNRPLTVALKRLQHDAPQARDFRPDLPLSWNSAIRMCLDRNPLHRPSTAAQVVSLLQRRTNVVERLATRRNTSIAGAGLAITALLLKLKLQPTTPNPEAILSYRRGETLANGRRTATELNEAIKEYKRAVGLQPDYLDAWIGLANAYSAASNFAFIDAKAGKKNARQAAEKAISLNRRSARAHGVLAYLISNDIRSWRTAGPHFQTAVALDAHDPMIRLWYATYLGKLSQGSAAVEQLKAGLDVDPTSMVLLQQLATEYLRLRKYEQCYRQALELRRLHPMAASSHYMVARAAAQLGRFDEARSTAADAVRFELQEAVANSLLSVIATRMNDLNTARVLASKVEEYWRSSPADVNHVVCPFVQLNDFDKAMQLLEAGLIKECDGILIIHRNPWMDPIRAHAPYVDFCKRLGVSSQIA